MELVISFLVAILVFVLLLLRSVSRVAERRGRQGERYVAHQIQKYVRKFPLSQDLHDLILQTPDGTTQIDHLIISPFGIFVIETKNLSGWIFGDENNSSWTQVLYKKKYRFQNPLRQNFKHQKAVQKLLQVESRNLHSVVVFAGSNTFKTERPRNVVSLRQLVPYLKLFNQPIYDHKKIERLAYVLRKHIHDNPTTLSEHIQNVEQNQRNPKCPQCGEPMVLRTAKKGNNAGSKFWGCSNFPRCRRIRKLN